MVKCHDDVAMLHLYLEFNIPNKGILLWLLGTGSVTESTLPTGLESS
jgi:hypothetical protein